METITTDDIISGKYKKPWWTAMVTTVVMAIGGSTGAIINYLDNKDARAHAREEARAETSVQEVWVSDQVAVFEKELADLNAAVRVQEAITEGLRKRLELIERRSGRSAVRASRRIRVEVPAKNLAQKEELKAIQEKRPPKPKRSDHRVQQAIKE